MAENHTNKERLKDITDSIERGIQDLFQSDKYAAYLRTMSRFHRYSVNNTMLIYMQKPDATLVAGFHKWRDQFGRNVKKGEKGIKIIAPTPYKKKIEQEKRDPDTGLPMLDADGRAIVEEKEIKIPMYKPVMVFDVSQTEGNPLPQLASDLSGNVRNYAVFMEALRRSAPVPIEIIPIRDGTDGYFSLDNQKISIRAGMSEVQTVSAVVHEIAHSKLHNDKQGDRNTEEVEAESISYAVCAYYGIATGENSFGYIASWSKDKELKELRASLETINRTSSELIGDIDRHYAEILREREAELAVEPDVTDRETVHEAAGETAPEEGAEAPSDGAGPIDAIAHNVQTEAPIQAPDNGYLPDPSMSVEAMNAYGYTDGDMLPLSRERALELFERDIPIYMLYDGNTEAMAFETEDIVLFSGCFGITREDWDAVKDQIPPMDMETVHRKREQAFLDSTGDAYAIYQLKRDDTTTELRFMNSQWLQEKGLEPQYENYELVYTGALSGEGRQMETLEDLYRMFNIAQPQDFTGHSLSVSDIVALKQSGVVSYHYVDSVGYKELPDFRNMDNPLKNAEMLLEDDYGMIDGVINNAPKEPVKPVPKKEEPNARKPSVLARLRRYQEEDRKASTRHRSAERDL